MTKEPLHMVNFRMTKAEIERLDKAAAVCGLSRSQLIYNMVTAGMDEFDMFKKIGVIKTLCTVRDVLEVIRGKVGSDVADSGNDLPLKA